MLHLKQVPVIRIAPPGITGKVLKKKDLRAGKNVVIATAQKRTTIVKNIVASMIFESLAAYGVLSSTLSRILPYFISSQDLLSSLKALSDGQGFFG